jgi:hypothetical protein
MRSKMGWLQKLQSGIEHWIRSNAFKALVVAVTKRQSVVVGT